MYLILFLCFIVCCSSLLTNRLTIVSSKLKFQRHISICNNNKLQMNINSINYEPNPSNNSTTNNFQTKAKDILQKSKETGLKLSQNLKKRWLTGLTLGIICTLWIGAGNNIFILGFVLFSLIAQSEYYSLVKATGVLPAYKIGILSSFLCYYFAVILPQFHELIMPISVTMLMIWLLIFNKKSPKISEISTSLLGMFYIGYLPSFWVRLRTLDNISLEIPLFLKSFTTLTKGSVVLWYTWTSIFIADVFAYFIGKKYGKYKLSLISTAAGYASPNKTIEGAIGGFISCMLFTLLGAYLMKWPIWYITGPFYGLMISFIALIGDLTASMMKRDAGMKDSGTIFPGKLLLSIFIHIYPYLSIFIHIYPFSSILIHFYPY